jgi:hypothetical protein
MTDSLVGKHCRLLLSLRDAGGTVRSKEESVLIVKKQETLGKIMYLCQFQDGSATYLFAEEFEVTD